MKPAFHRPSRRQFLVGAGGFALPLPLLPSLLPTDAHAQSVADDSKLRYFVHTTFWHGVYPDQIFGSIQQDTLARPESTQRYAGFDIRQKTLPLLLDANGQRRTAFPAGTTRVNLSPILQAPTNVFTFDILSRLNLIDGLGVYRFINHNNGGPLGADTGIADDDSRGTRFATIDQVMARSTRLFPEQGRFSVITRNQVSRILSNGFGQLAPDTASSNIELFNAMFGDPNDTQPPQSQAVVVDKVQEHAGAVLRNPRLSADCRRRFNDYMEMLFQVQRNLQSSAGGGNAGPNIPRPTRDTNAIENSRGYLGNPDLHVEAEQLWNDVVVAGFAAGRSRIYTSGPLRGTFSTRNRQDWHDNVAHLFAAEDGIGTERMNEFNAASQLQFEKTQLHMINRLKSVTTADGRTLFDKALVVGTFEIGSSPDPAMHWSNNLPVWAFGDAGGFFKTGQYVDYRNGNTGNLREIRQAVFGRNGLLLNQWLGMVMRSMGMQKAEYQGNGADTGYPPVQPIVNGGVAGTISNAVWNEARNDLPFIRGSANAPDF